MDAMDETCVRWLIRRDMPEVLRIEADSFEFPWADDDFHSCLLHRECIGMVAEHDSRIVGFMVYELHKSQLQILNFAVSPSHRRRGVGALMVERLFEKLNQQCRTSLTVEVRERNVSAQMFFRSQGFRAISILSCHYEDTDEDAYVMQYRMLAKVVN